MELEREKGITIKSAATFTKFNDTNINIIDTPGHVDFTIEVERALRVLDGAILVLCSVGGVQSQTSTVDRQMKRYGVPRLCFINKMDRMGANPWRVIDQLRSKLKIGAAAVQIPIGRESEFEGVVDLVEMKAIYNNGDNGEELKIKPIPSDLIEEAKKRRKELFECLADYDEQMSDIFLEEREPSNKELKDAVRRATLSLNFAPVFMGSAFKNKSVQPVLQGVVDYLPNPTERQNFAFNMAEKENKIEVLPDSSKELVSLAFKLEDTKFGQLTYMRVYQGSLKKGTYIYNVRNKTKTRLSRLVRMHSDEMEEVDQLGAGEIGAVFGIECASGDSFTEKSNIALTSMFIPDPVVSFSIKPVKETPNFSKALNKFMKEDPTFKVSVNGETKETIISGMGELHLDIYVERMKREFGCDCVTGKPQVEYRETITEKAHFDYTHKKQTGGSGQYGKVVGYLEPILNPNEEVKKGKFIEPENEYLDQTVGQDIPFQFIPSIGKGFFEACEKGKYGFKIKGARFVLLEGAAHQVDSSDIAFRLAAIGAFRSVYETCRPIVKEPIMNVTITAPQEFQSNVMSQINKRKGVIHDSEILDDYVTFNCDIPLAKVIHN